MNLTLRMSGKRHRIDNLFRLCYHGWGSEVRYGKDHTGFRFKSHGR